MKGLKGTFMAATAALLLGLGGTATSALALTLDFSNVVGATVEFNGTGSFEFVNGVGGFDFKITSAGPANGLQGNISGPFNIGPITINGSTQSANVTGLGKFSIFDGSFTLKGDLDWVDIETKGTGGNLNIIGNVNLTNISYVGGTHPGLAPLANGADGIVAARFGFVPAKSLTQLASSPTPNSTSYAGNISVPEPMSLLLLGAGLTGLGIVRRKIARG